MKIFSRIKIYMEMIKFSHTLFALPFALAGAFLAAKGVPDGWTLFYILLAMAGGRSAAMGLNRVIDAEIDRENPRTKERHIPRGIVSKREGWVLIALSFLVLIFAAYRLNPLCLKLSPILIFLLIIYSYTKRFTWASHIVLGLALGAAPLGAWIAVTGAFDWRVLFLSFAVLFWVAGFDIIYSLLDVEFDRRFGLYSIPRVLGIRKSLFVSRGFHFLTALSMLFVYFFFSLGTFYLTGMAVCLLLLAYEHSLVKEDDLSRVNVAFFNVNGYISITYLLFTFLDIVIHRG